MHRFQSLLLSARTDLLSASVLALCAPNAALADDLAPPTWPRLGLPNYTTAAEWEFFGPAGGSPYIADGVEVPLIVGDGITGLTDVPPQVLPDNDIAWVPYDGDGGYLGGANGISFGTLNFRIANWIDTEPLKIIHAQFTYDPGPAGLSPFIEYIIATDPLPIDSVLHTSTTDAPIPGDPLGRWHRVETWEIKPNPDFESIQVIVPEGVLVDQAVIDTISTVPEPSALSLLALGALTVTRRRKS